jgi:hypothetical protein
MPLLWDLLAPEARQRLCEYQYARYKVLPDVAPLAEPKLPAVEEEPDAGLVRKMKQKPNPSREARA